MNLAHRARLQKLTHLLPGRDIAEGVAGHEANVGSCDRFLKLSRFLFVEADRFLRQDVLTGLDGGEGAFVERVMRGRDEDSIHIRALQQLLRRRIHRRAAGDRGDTRRGRLVGIGAGDDAPRVTLDDGLRQDAALVAAADDADTQASLIFHDGPPRQT